MLYSINLLIHFVFLVGTSFLVAFLTKLTDNELTKRTSNGCNRVLLVYLIIGIQAAQTTSNIEINPILKFYHWNFIHYSKYTLVFYTKKMSFAILFKFWEFLEKYLLNSDLLCTFTGLIVFREVLTSKFKKFQFSSFRKVRFVSREKGVQLLQVKCKRSLEHYIRKYAKLIRRKYLQLKIMCFWISPIILDDLMINQLILYYSMYLN